MNEKLLHEKKFLTWTVVVFLLFTIYILSSLFSLIVFSFIFAYFLNPIHDFFKKKIKNNSASAIITLLSATFGILFPFFFLLYFIILNLLKQFIIYLDYIKDPITLYENISSFFSGKISPQVLDLIDFGSFFSKIIGFLGDYTQAFFSKLPLIILGMVIVLFLTYYILIYKQKILDWYFLYLPLRKKHLEEFLERLSINIKTLFKGYFLTGVLQTFVAFIGYVIFDVPNILIFTFLTFIISLIPYIGTPLIWVPLSIYLVFSGQQIAGVGLFIYGLSIISLVDNFVRPILMSSKETIPPALVFVGFIGGLFTFGISGIILGPIIIFVFLIFLGYLFEDIKKK